MRKVLLAFVVLTCINWTHGSGILSGPFTATNPFRITVPPSIAGVGATVTPSAVGGFRTANGITCNIAATPFDLSPAADNSTDQYLIGNDDCTLSVESVPSGWTPRNALVQLFYPAIQAQRVVRLATGDGVTRRFAAIGGEAAPGGGTYGMLPLSPVNGTVRLTAGTVVGTDSGTLQPDGKMSITGAGISSCTIVVLTNNTYTDANLSTHAGYYDCTFDVAPANGVPITIALQYGFAAPSRNVANPIFNSGGLYSMFRIQPSADDPIARQTAYKIKHRQLTGSGIAVLDPAVVYGVQPGQATARPCVDMTQNCTHTGANSNYAAAQAACPENSPGNTYSYNAASKVLTFTATGTAGNRRTYCGFECVSNACVPGADQTAHYITVKFSKFNYTALRGPRFLGHDVWIDNNEIYTDNFDPSIIHVPLKGGCLAMNFFSAIQTGNKVRNNYFHDCSNDGINVVNLENFEVLRNRIDVSGGLEPTQHPDGFQTQGSGSAVARFGLLSGNYVTCYARFHAQTYLQFVNGAKIQSQCNASIYLEEYGAAGITQDITVTNNFADGGVFNFMFSGGVNMARIALTNNIVGTNNVFVPGSAFDPSPQTGNVNAYSGGPADLW
jgi:hypothetical protein